MEQHEEILGLEGKLWQIILPCSTGIVAHLGVLAKRAK